MKRILLSLILSLPLISMGQSLTITYGDSSVFGHVNSHDVEAHIHVQNLTGSDQDVMVKRIDGNYNNITDSNAICWGVCFAPDVSVSPFPISIDANKKDSTNFVAHLYPDGDRLTGCGDITYVFFIDGNPSDSVAFTINYCLTADFSIEEDQISHDLSVFPNPAVGKTTVSYKLSSNENNFFELYNLLGTTIYSQKLTEREGQFELNVSEYSKGIYFYALKSQGTIVENKKMVIK